MRRSEFSFFNGCYENWKSSVYVNQWNQRKSFVARWPLVNNEKLLTSRRETLLVDSVRESIMTPFKTSSEKMKFSVNFMLFPFSLFSEIRIDALIVVPFHSFVLFFSASRNIWQMMKLRHTLTETKISITPLDHNFFLNARYIVYPSNSKSIFIDRFYAECYLHVGTYII
jgi:hypothetical protein